MSQLCTGSICLTDLINNAKVLHSANTKASNGKIYTNILIWQNDEPDKFGNTISIQLNSTKEKKDIEGKIYVGNAKKMEAQAPQPITAADTNVLEEPLDDLPF